MSQFTDTDAWEKNRIDIEANNLAMERYQVGIDLVTDSLQKQQLIDLATQRIEIEQNTAAWKQYGNIYMKQHDLQTAANVAELRANKEKNSAILNTLGASLKAQRQMRATYNMEILDEWAQKAAQYVQIFSQMTDMINTTAQMSIDQRRAALDAELEEIDRNNDAIRKSAKYQMASGRMRMVMDAKMEKARKEKEAEQDQARRDLFKKEKELQVRSAIMNTAGAIINALTVKPAWLGYAMSIMFAALGAEQISMIKSQQYTGRFGGLIGGKLHTGGGTNIEAEKGEYLMRREAVSNLGVGFMDAVNTGNKGIVNSVTNNRSNDQVVNVHFSGNILSDDFLEDEALPKIKEMLRRGSDI